MMMEPGDLLVLAVLLGAWGAIFAQRVWNRRKRMRVSRRAIRGEKKATQILEKLGYQVLDKQLSGTVRYYVDETLKESRVRADLLVKKRGKEYIVEIKTGEQANPNLPAVRRQMMEYDQVFGPHGILFVDMEKNRIQTVRFRHPTGGWKHRITDVLFGFVAGLLIAVSVYAVIS